MLVYSLFIYFDMKMLFQNNTAQTCRYPRLFFVSGHGTTVPARDNSPSFQEGVPEGRGSNIGIRIPCDNWQRPPAAAGAPTPASGHPFPKEGELSLGRCCSQWPRYFFLLPLLLWHTI